LPKNNEFLRNENLIVPYTYLMFCDDYKIALSGIAQSVPATGLTTRFQFLVQLRHDTQSPGALLSLPHRFSWAHVKVGASSLFVQTICR
jgi:hypothetical protein